jgi:hypothetical protein
MTYLDGQVIVETVQIVKFSLKCPIWSDIVTFAKTDLGVEPELEGGECVLILRTHDQQQLFHTFISLQGEPDVSQEGQKD